MFLGHLLERALGDAPGIAPRRASRFEPDGDAPELAAVETAAGTPAPARDTLAPPTPQAPSQRPGPVETLLIERRAERPQTAPSPIPHAPLVVERAVEQPSVRLAPVRETRPELAPRREPAPEHESEPSRLTPAAPPIERHTETILRETAETRIESRTIERRLESLVREIQRIEEVRTILPAPAAEPPQTAAPARSPSPEPRNVVVPAAATRGAAPRPVLMEAASPAPAAPVVQVTIGRVEVRAAAPPAAQHKPRAREPRLDLEDYLRQRERA